MSQTDTDDQPFCFASLGLVVIDEIRFPNQQPLENVLGGSGAYATLGARLFLPSPSSRSLAWPIRVGNDFPNSISDFIQEWDIQLDIELKPGKKSTRGLLEYQDTTFGPKKFKYTTPLLLIEEEKLQRQSILTSKVLHYLASPEDLKQRIQKLFKIRKSLGNFPRPLIIWEPAPLSCDPENLHACLEAAKLVDVFSPNHLEIARLFGISESADYKKPDIEKLALEVLRQGVGPEGNGVVLVRAGEMGCLVQSRKVAPKWLPPFYGEEMRKEQSHKVIDPTGAGNAFLGAYSIGYLRTEDIIEAACYGSVAASFALEQVGMPTKSKEGDQELWNGVNVLERLYEYKRSMGPKRGS